MHRCYAGLIVLLTLSMLPPNGSFADESEGLPTIAERTAGLEPRPGLLVTYADPRNGKLWLELPAPTAARGEIARFLYVEGLVSGLGSNPVGLDRGQLGRSRLVVLRRVGNKVLVDEPNLAFRALGADPAERRAVEQSFASSVLWAGPVAAEEVDGRVLVDFTSFVVRDAHEVGRRLEASGEGAFRLDVERSVIDFGACLAFPDNLELEAWLTFAGDEPGPEVRSVAPTDRAFTLIQHHSLLRLPEPGYRPRRFDPRAGSFEISFQDYAVPLDEPIDRRLIVRHRLEKVDPDAARSRVREPLVYYVDRGTPEPVRSALIEGAAWWASAFDAAGFVDAFRVELLPEGAHPLDVRYNVIQWVHRATRGWSYGGGVIDPRTGEMVKAHVNLGSLRVRQDRLIFEGLLGADGTGAGGAADPIQLALARVRQLSAHEVGHTLGLAHNFAASTYADRASVMDYPAPLVEVRADGGLDVERAYGVGLGLWDVHAIRYAYSEFPAGADETTELDAIVRRGLRDGLVFLTDRDARPPGAAQPLASLWDNGSDAVRSLGREMAVRRVALAGFGERNLAVGQPLGLLERTLVPIYLYHRYQLEAAWKVVGGLDYVHALRGDGQPPARPIAAERQRAALRRVLDALEPAELDLPDAVVERLLPPPPGTGSSRERFDGHADPAFDTISAAATLAGLVVDGLLDPARLARVVEFHRRDSRWPGLVEVLDTVVDAAFEIPADLPGRQVELARAVQRVVVAGLIRRSASGVTPPMVRSGLDDALERLVGRVAAGRVAESGSGAVHLGFLEREMRRYLERREIDAADVLAVPPPPPGSPIGNSIGSRRGCSGFHATSDLPPSGL